MRRNHKVVFVLVLAVAALTLLLSVVSFAQSSSSSTVSVSSGGVSGEFGFMNGQGSLADTTSGGDDETLSTSDLTFKVASATNISKGDALKISDGTNSDYATVSSITSTTLTIKWITSGNTYNGSTTDFNVDEVGRYASSASWTPIVDSTGSITAGNHFIANLTGMSTSDSALVEIFHTNVDENVKNYTYLHRLVNVLVLDTDATADCADGPETGSTIAGTVGTWCQAKNAAGTDISAVDSYMTLTNARQAFILTGGYVYSLIISDGVFYTVDTTEGTGDSLSPTDLAQLTAF